jgi:sigma-E factor negative regulatory protein RseC
METIVATEKGIVIKIDSSTARVRTTKSSECQSCTARHSCSATAAGGNMEVDAVNAVGAQVGDRILLYFETGSLLKATFLLYIFPILGMLLGATIGHWFSLKNGMNPSAPAAATGFLFLILSFLIVRSKANKLAQNNHYRPKIIKVLGHETL